MLALDQVAKSEPLPKQHQLQDSASSSPFHAPDNRKPILSPRPIARREIMHHERQSARTQARCPSLMIFLLILVSRVFALQIHPKLRSTSCRHHDSHSCQQRANKLPTESQKERRHNLDLDVGAASQVGRSIITSRPIPLDRFSLAFFGSFSWFERPR